MEFLDAQSGPEVKLQLLDSIQWPREEGKPSIRISYRKEELVAAVVTSGRGCGKAYNYTHWLLVLRNAIGY